MTSGTSSSSSSSGIDGSNMYSIRHPDGFIDERVTPNSAASREILCAVCASTCQVPCHLRQNLQPCGYIRTLAILYLPGPEIAETLPDCNHSIVVSVHFQVPARTSSVSLQRGKSVHFREYLLECHDSKERSDRSSASCHGAPAANVIRHVVAALMDFQRELGDRDVELLFSRLWTSRGVGGHLPSRARSRIKQYGRTMHVLSAKIGSGAHWGFCVNHQDNGIDDNGFLARSKEALNSPCTTSMNTAM